MKFHAINLTESNSFWAQYESLWLQSDYNSPYNSSGFFQLLSENYRNQGVRAFIFSNEQNVLMGVVFFRMQKDTFIFLGDGHTDHNVIAWGRGISTELKISFLEYVIKECKSKIFLKNIPPWVEDIKIWEEAGKISNNVISFKAWECPTVENTSSDLTDKEFLLSRFKKSRLQTYFNKLKKMPGFSLLIEETANDNLRSWIDEHCLNHETKWNLTQTPSNYVDNGSRKLLLQKVLNWHREGLCVRFSVLIDTKLVASVICLKDRKRLIYCLPSYFKEYENTHVSQVLVSYIGQWAAEKGFSVFDFGVGGEEYKLRFANELPFVNRIYISRSKFSNLYLKGIFDQSIRDNKILRTVWNKFVLDIFRGKVVKFKSDLFNKGKVFLTENVVNYKIGIKKLSHRLNSRSEFFYGTWNQSHPTLKKEMNIRILSTYEILDFLSIQTYLNPTQRSNYIKLVLKKERIPFGLFVNDELVQLSWIKEGTEDYIANHLQKVAEGNKLYTILDCFTSKSHRGKGFYSLMLKYLTSHYENNAYYIIYTDNWNMPSQKGILKSGFIKIAEKITIKANKDVQWKLI